jgi:tricarballylate dehydrogenase
VSLDADVIIVGAGNAACCAALAARESGASVLVLESAPVEERGGNSTYTAGAMRVVYNGVQDLLKIVPDLTEEEIETVDFGKYTDEQFFDDMARLTEYRADPDMVEILVRQSFETLCWMREVGVRFRASFGRQAYKVGGRFRFWGGLACEVWGGGPGLVDALHTSAEKKGIKILYGAPALSLLTDDDGVRGVLARIEGRSRRLSSRAVVLACGGFESNAEMRARYLGPSWDFAKVRGTRYNTGKGIEMALAAGALPYGHWSGAHSVAWDMNAPMFGDLAVGDAFQKHSYPFGIVVNNKGERFIDEGADFRNYTYAKYGREILAQPGASAWQVFDGKVEHLLRDEYRIRQITAVTADTLPALAAQMEGVDGKTFQETVRAFNAAVRQDVPFDPNSKDGRGTTGLHIPKSNWANTLDTPPFRAFGVTCGITFTFGGLKVTPDAAVEDVRGEPIPGLFAAGELVGGLFYNNYPGGSGLTAGAVFGRLAGNSAARMALDRRR